MTPVIAILAHKDLHRVAQVTRYLAGGGLRVAIHVDESVPAEEFDSFKISLAGLSEILWVNRIACEWGDFSLVEATISMSEAVLKRWSDAGHVILLSGDSLPIRSPAALIEFLRNNQGVDFIESVDVGDDNWITGGLGIERFTLSFPFSWKKQRRMFDFWVEAQRLFRVKRALPSGLRAHIGSQWWCLSRRTIEAILGDTERSVYDAYFRKCWIPDESYFQTLARKHARTIESQALTFSHFDHQGKPTTFYDDHVDDIKGLDAFFIRKIWSGSDKLYQHFLQATQYRGNDSDRTGIALEKIKVATDRRKTGRNGLYMHGRAPSQWFKKHSPTAVPYDVLTGFDAVFPEIDNWIESQIDVRPHGRMFASKHVEFANGASTGPGGVSNNTSIRDLAPESFLCNLVWSTRNSSLKFHFELDDDPKIETFLLSDPNATRHHIHHGWILALMAEKISNSEYLRSTANTMLSRERTLIVALNDAESSCGSNIWTLGEVLADPLPTLQATLGSSTAERTTGPVALPAMVDATQLFEFARDLKNIGVDIDVSLLEPASTANLNDSTMQANDEQTA